MRLPISSVIASLVIALTAPSSASFAQQNATGSTIRLVSASEPARDSTDDESNTQSNQPAMEQRQSAPPIQEPEQPADRSGPTLAPPIVHRPSETAANNRARMPAGF